MPARFARTFSLATAAIMAVGSLVVGDSDSAVAAVPTCADLAAVTIPASDIGMATGGARVVSATVEDSPQTGAYCKVQGEIRPVDQAAPPIRFQVNLPDRWNGRSLMLGGGGYDGVLPSGTQPLPLMPYLGPWPVARGYATYGSDSGHTAQPGNDRDGSFMQNDEALKNYAGDALKKTHDVAMNLISRKYGSAPRTRYVAGGSTGGREALLAVSRWPKDFDGALVFFPAWNVVAQNLHRGQTTQKLAREGAYPSPTQRESLMKAAIQRCDSLDGLSDGVISNQAKCDTVFNPKSATVDGAKLRCQAGRNLGGACLSDEQIDAFRSFDTPLRLPYRLANGENSYPGVTTWGTDFGRDGTHPMQPFIRLINMGSVPPAHPMPPFAGLNSPPHSATFWDEWVRYAVTRDPSFDSLSLDPRNPRRWQDRIVELSRLQEVDPAQFDEFQRRGGKIILVHGVHDGVVSNRASRQFVDALGDRLGSGRVREMVRYYEVPGFGHGLSTVFQPEWDGLPVLQSWVEGGTAPGPQVVRDVLNPTAPRTRPLCEAPTWPRYVGGDANAASSFECVPR